MSTTKSIDLVNLPAGEDLNDALYHALTINASGQVIQTDATTDRVIGSLAENPGRTTVAGDMVAVQLVGKGGVGLVKANAAITAGHLLVPTATDGKVAGVANIAALSANQMGFGIALEAATAADEVIRYLAQVIAGPTA